MAQIVTARGISRATRYRQLGRFGDELAVFDVVLARFGATEPGLREHVARALVNKGVALAKLGRPEDELAVFDDVLARFGATEPALREHVARALVNKGVALGQLGRFGAELAVYDDVLARFGDATEPPLRQAADMARTLATHMGPVALCLVGGSFGTPACAIARAPGLRRRLPSFARQRRLSGPQRLQFPG